MAEPDTKKIACPEHPGRHMATLYCFPHVLQGVWECPDGLAGDCEHPGRHTEIVTTDFMNAAGEPDQYDTEAYVCDNCGVVIDPDVADPAIDRQEAEAEYCE